MSDPQTTNPIAEAKENVAEAVPTPPPQQMPESSAQAVKSRLQWGEPALTILDVRDRAAFNQARIRGALPMPMDELTDRAISSLEPQREIYVYADNDQQSNQAASPDPPTFLVHRTEFMSRYFYIDYSHSIVPGGLEVIS
ncbi:hypothetical protein MC7420_5251 [Coleofasciculus chthonoplastes PCC 7420]|uniref:Rhodanese domain-containing protein n=1 Tax=Coleofasciculus chthonoplastes PCC 7420 TaxID=118168 RepID=B4W2M4_9CYAN|nr:rhodanese-like domain-containing protein [Coleofasciculus chthonoplastes]EDX71626.1 hypothetical protein MC7420_5251 [Coleofasciculus chthonoplastes PCC 7420]